MPNLPDRNATIQPAKVAKKKKPELETQVLVRRERGDKRPDRNRDKAIAVSEGRFKESVKNHRTGLDSNPFRDMKSDAPFESGWKTRDDQIKADRQKLRDQGIAPTGKN